MSDSVIASLVENARYYHTATIPGGMYHGAPDDRETFGVGAAFVTSAKVPEKVIYNVVEAAVKKINQFTKRHPAFKGREKRKLLRGGLSAPLHAGSIRIEDEINSRSCLSFLTRRSWRRRLARLPRCAKGRIQ